MSLKKRMHKENERKYYNCCVLRCLNTTWNSKWTFFSLPPDPESCRRGHMIPQFKACLLKFRRKVWLKLIQRDDLNSNFSDHHRVCEDHFDAHSILISPNRKCLKKNSIPTNRLPKLPDTKHEATQGLATSSEHIESSTGITKRTIKSTVSLIGTESGQLQEGYYCNVCSNGINGFRYVCVQCPDFDLCNDCEAKREHAQHYMLRVPGVRSQEEILFVLEKIREELFNNDDIEKCLKIEIKEEPDKDPLGVIEELYFENTPTPDNQLGSKSETDTVDVNYTATSDIPRKRRHIKSNKIQRTEAVHGYTLEQVSEEPSLVHIRKKTTQLCKATKPTESESMTISTHKNSSTSMKGVETKQLTSQLYKATKPDECETMTISTHKNSCSSIGVEAKQLTSQLCKATKPDECETMTISTHKNSSSSIGVEAKQLTSQLCKATKTGECSSITISSQNKPSNSTIGIVSCNNVPPDSNYATWDSNQ